MEKKTIEKIQGVENNTILDSGERHTAKSMLTQLRQCIENKVIEKDEVPKLKTIQNWITHYTNQHHQEAAEIMARAQEKT
ncbi:6128_t:CDS:2 [Dentiscutata erythropus]|uniref:6128_t:CDS:1 n=1 Tax=Dentiscutata erythropus TaxID=1348616 RepID=A0A9N9PDT8_9GLOM|nr:6128_t:CDS:2 [Dentiscutata erythropus]